MTVSGYIYEAIRILTTLIMLGIGFRCVKVIITLGIVEGDWARAIKKIKNQILAAIFAVTVLETLLTVKKIFGG